MNIKNLTLITAALIAISGCSESNAWFNNEPCYFPDTPGALAPYWICQARPHKNLISAVGYAGNSKAGATFSKQMAIADARVKLAQRLRGQCGISYVSEAMLVDSRLMNVQRSPREGYYAELGIRPSDLRLDCR